MTTWHWSSFIGCSGSGSSLVLPMESESVVLPLEHKKFKSKVYCSQVSWFYGRLGFRKTVGSKNCPSDCECTMGCEYMHTAFIPTADI